MLSCKHAFCRDCYTQYLVQKIRDEGESRRIQCPGAGCKLALDENTVKTVVPTEIFRKYLSLLIRTYVDDNEFLRWCPAPNCENVVECHVRNAQLESTIPSVTCRCGFKFCFGYVVFVWELSGC